MSSYAGQSRQLKTLHLEEAEEKMLALARELMDITSLEDMWLFADFSSDLEDTKLNKLIF